MKIHALRADGRAVCGLEIPLERLVDLSTADDPNSVTCSSCRRLADVETGKSAGSDEDIRALVREEISLGIEQLLRIGEAADVLAVSKKKVLKLIEKGELSVVAISKKKQRVPSSSVEAYIRRKTVTG